MPQDLEFHIPISPTDHFFTMVHYFAASLAERRPAGGQPHRGDGRRRTSRETICASVCRGRAAIRSSGGGWISTGSARHSYYATAVDRFRGPFQAPR